MMECKNEMSQLRTLGGQALPASSRHLEAASSSRHRSSHSSSAARALEPRQRTEVVENTSVSKSNTSTGMSGDWLLFMGLEMGEIDPQELRKIQIDIRRKIPESQVQDLPVERGLQNPQSLMIPRRGEEGASPMFNRPELEEARRRQQEKETEEKVQQPVKEPRVMVIRKVCIV